MFISDADLEAKFRVIPSIFKSWMSKHMDLGSSTVVDFGCDFGVITAGLAMNAGIGRVIGVEINDHHTQLLDGIRARLGMHRLPGNLEFRRCRPGSALASPASLDCIFSWSVFEHIDQKLLERTVADHHDALVPGGFAFVQIAPLYYSAYGAHLQPLITRPWVHLSMQDDLLEREVFNARTVMGVSAPEEFGETASEEMKRSIWSCYKALNKLTADDLIELFPSQGFELVEQYRSKVSDTPTPALLRVFREDVLMTEQVVAIFRKGRNRR